MTWEILGSAPAPLEAPTAAGEAADLRPWGHRYAVRVMSMAINLVLFANLTLRAAAQSFRVLEQPECPSFWTIRTWVLRLGLYELQRTKIRASDWVFIVDATIAVGQHKALVILGVRLSWLRGRDFSLGHQDVVILGLEILTRCDGLAVYAQLEEAARAVGIPRAVVSDDGGDLRKGMRLFRQAHPEVDWFHDLTHRLALMLEKELSAAAWWSEFLSRVGQCRQACQQTAWSHLLPPAQRTKARWFNLEPLIRWALRVVAYGRRQAASSDAKFEALFGWLAPYEPDLAQARQLVVMMKAVCVIIKRKGLDRATVERCARRITRIAKTEGARAFGRQILGFLREQLAQLKPGETMLGSSDVIESLFGKYKGVVERSPMKAITVMVLLVAALTSERTPAVIREAMETVGVAEVEAWFAANGEPTLLAKRRAELNDILGTKHA